MNTTAVRRLWVLISLVVLGGLFSSVPVTCICPESQHLGMAIHPIFPHNHPEEAVASTSFFGSMEIQSTSLSASQGSLLLPIGDGAIFYPVAAAIILLLLLIGSMRHPRIRRRWAAPLSSDWPSTTQSSARLMIVGSHGAPGASSSSA